MRPGVEDIIKREIELMFGRRIASSRDCIQLSEEIFRITHARLSHNTMRRFYGLVKTDYSPSHSTIQILCNYCGFLSIEDVENYSTEKNSFSDSQEQKSLLNYLVNLFSESPVDDEINETFKSVVKQTILFLNHHPALVEKFQSMVAKTKKGQDYYFESFVNIDRLNSFYGNGLRYYLNEKDGPEAKVFGNSLLVFRYWLTEDEINLERHFRLVNINSLYSSNANNSQSRYFASLLFYEHAKGISSTNTVASIQEYYAEMHKEDMAAQIHFEITIAEALILTGIYDEGLLYTNSAMKKINNADDIEESALQNVYLLQAVALYKTNNLESAKETYGRIRPSAFNFLSKKLHTILYGFLSGELGKNSNEPDESAGLLILETGFSRLAKLIR
ncbi:MAG: hypothetical protein ABIN89_28595 [Chitinophagaceae bacterium]